MPTTMACKPLRVDRVVSKEGVAGLEAEWRQLFQLHGEGLPFRTWDWHQAWWRNFGASSLPVTDVPRLVTFRDGAGVLVGVAPLVLTRRPGRGPAGARVLDFIGHDPNVTEIRGLLCNRALEVEVHSALRRHLVESADEWDWFHWRGLRASSTARPAVLSSPGVRIDAPVTAYTLPVADTWEAFRASRSRNIKEALRKCANSLRRDGHAAEFVVATSIHDVPKTLERFFELHAMRARSPDGVSHPDVFASQASRTFLVDAFTRFASRGEARAFLLQIRGKVVAIRLGFALGDTLYLYYSGYDPGWRRYSVMTTVVANAIQHAILEGRHFVHLSTGTDVSKTRWHPCRQDLLAATEVSPSWRGRLSHSVFGAVHARRDRGPLYRAARWLLGRESLKGPATAPAMGEDDAAGS
jgi:CelD/BcsL family acetyltransferase involved in cellulose biosynthesis